MADLKVTINNENKNCTVVSLEGEITPETTDKLRQSFDVLVMESPERIELDLSEVGYIASAGVGALVSFLRKIKEKGGELSLCCLKDEIYDLFRITHLDKVFDIKKKSTTAL